MARHFDRDVFVESRAVADPGHEIHPCRALRAVVQNPHRGGQIGHDQINEEPVTVADVVIGVVRERIARKDADLEFRKHREERKQAAPPHAAEPAGGENDQHVKRAERQFVGGEVIRRDDEREADETKRQDGGPTRYSAMRRLCFILHRLPPR